MQRLIAEWISGATEDAAGRVEYQYERKFSVHSGKLDEAKAMAVAGGKAANVTEWAGVILQEWIVDKRTGHWETRETWRGDWDGGWDHEVIAEAS
jgi:hypothetical protein